MKHFMLAASLAAVCLFSSCEKQFEVNRTTVIEAPANAVWSQVASYENWRNWSPWYANDSTMKWEVESDNSGYSWTSENSGSGYMKTTDVNEGKRLDYHTHFYEPWESESPGYVELSEVDGGTEVKWGFSGSVKFPFSLFMNMDKVVGKDFEQGLGLLKTHVETNPMPSSEHSHLEIIDFVETHYLGQRETIKMEAMQPFFEAHLMGAFAAVEAAGGELLGAPVGVYFKWDEENGETDLLAGVPVAENQPLANYTIETVAAGKAIKYAYYGGFEGSYDAHMAINEYIENNADVNYRGPVIEEYVTDPAQEPDTSKWLTNIYYLVE